MGLSYNQHSSGGLVLIDLAKYRSDPAEKARISDLMSLLPIGMTSVLEIGARDGYICRLLAERFPRVIALDITLPQFDVSGLLPLKATVVALPFPDNTFDVVLCSEVLEHIPEVQTACSELVRVAKHMVIVGVPYKEDTRLGRTTCQYCGKPNPPWGHVNEFDEKKLTILFAGTRAVETRYVWSSSGRTNEVSRWLLDCAGNPWGNYCQDEPCIFCAHELGKPKPRNLVQKVCSWLATMINDFQAVFVKSHANWIHVTFAKEGSPATHQVLVASQQGHRG